MPGAWSSPATWTPGQIVTDVLLNAQLRDNLLWLGGTTGVITQPLATVGATSNPTTASTSLVALIDPIVSLTTAASSSVFGIAVGTFTTSVAAQATFELLMDGTASTNAPTVFTTTGTQLFSIVSFGWWPSTSAATHVLQLYWATSTGTLTRGATDTQIFGVEFRR